MTLPSLRVSLRSSSIFPPFASCFSVVWAAAGRSAIVTDSCLCPASSSSARARPAPPSESAPASRATARVRMEHLPPDQPNAAAAVCELDVSGGTGGGGGAPPSRSTFVGQPLGQAALANRASRGGSQREGT